MYLFLSQSCDNDANSCYYSASHTEHTDNYCSTDEHENIFQHTKLHSSDSGADISERNIIEKHMESVNYYNQQAPSESEKRDINVINNSNSNNKNVDDDETMSDNDAKMEYHHERNNSLPELFGDEAHQNGWEKYWAKNGERLIWQSWIEKYIDYINPDYIDQNNMPVFDNNSNSNKNNDSSADTNRLTDDNMEQIFTFDVKDINKLNNQEIVITPPAKQQQQNNEHNEKDKQQTDEDLLIQGWNQLSPESAKNEDYQNHRRQHHNNHQYYSFNNNNNQHDNLLLSPPRCESLNSSIPLTIGTSDSMTNVTRMTISSFGFESSHVTSESTPTSTPSEESNNTISSFTDTDNDGEEEEESENQMTTRIANECERLLMQNKPDEHLAPSSDKDSEEYWQTRWQSHAQEQYVKHYNDFMETHRILQDEMSSSFKSDSGFLPGENCASSNNCGGASAKFNKRRRKSGRKKGGSHSLQRLVANLNLRSDLAKYSHKDFTKSDCTKSEPETMDGGDDNNSKDQQQQQQQHHDPSQSDSTIVDTTEASLMESMGLPVSFGRRSNQIGANGGDDEKPPDDDRPINLKRSHENDTENMNESNNNDHIKSQFDLMGYAFNDDNNEILLTGEIVYRKKHVRLHNRMLKMLPSITSARPKHTYFDDDGNEIIPENIQSGNELLHTSSDEDIPLPLATATANNRLSSSFVPLTSQLSSEGYEANEDNNKDELVNINLSIDQDHDSNCVDESQLCDQDCQQQISNNSQQTPVGIRKEKKKKRKGKFQMNIPVEIANDKALRKYWYKRFSLFSMFDFGIRLDRGELIN
jgi:trimethylguanosine synthase